MKTGKYNDEVEESDSLSNERLLRHTLRRERLLYRAGIQPEFGRLGRWHRHCKHGISPQRRRLNCLIMRSPILPYSDRIISQHLSRTQQWMRNPGRSSLCHGITVIRKVKIFHLHHSLISIFSSIFPFSFCFVL
uniref:Uncharacterized protein n=1 Tax=Elaeophora elaphi TaxID=1147741 RepID=A0A0R3RI13_9BILA